MSGSITDFVNAGFAGVHQETADTVAKIDGVMDELETQPQEVIDLAVAGIVKRTAEKRNGAEAIAFAKKLGPVFAQLLASA